MTARDILGWKSPAAGNGIMAWKCVDGTTKLNTTKMRVYVFTGTSQIDTSDSRLDVGLTENKVFFNINLLRVDRDAL